MCGLAGGWSARGFDVLNQALPRMTAALVHRGPDDFGHWVDRDAGVALGHRRLAVVDLSPAGHQPMVSPAGRWVIVFNGEIYNHSDLRAVLEASGYAPVWRGHSDTETLLACIDAWGVDATLRRIVGMFAFALWDRETRTLALARDRAGEKPLYYGWQGDTFLFGSELKALTAHPEWRGEIDRDVLALYLRHAYVPDPHCIYRDVFKLPPGHWLEMHDGKPQAPMCYWDFRQVVAAPKLAGTPEDLTDELEARLGAAVALRMEADVPLGAFLSGGIDSSAIVALMQARSTRPIRTFTIGFDVPGYNEAENAKAIARHLGTEHTELYLTPADALAVVPQLPQIWDEPFADSSQIPTLLLSRMTRDHVTVALSGDAGDELFCGYNRYGQGYALHRRLRRMPPFLRRIVSNALLAMPAHAIDSAVQKLPRPLRYPAIGDRLNKLGGVLAKAEGAEFYRALISQFQNPSSLTVGGNEAQTLLSRTSDWPELGDFRETMMFLDTLTYLPGDILTKVDRASMAVSLEARVPMLDHELIEFAWRLPLDVKLRDGQTKWILRQVLERHVPRNLIDRPKMGFGIPIEHWLSGPLRDWAENLLEPSRMRQQGYLNVPLVQSLWSEHISGRRRWHHQLWIILMFQAWMENAKRPAMAIA